MRRALGLVVVALGVAACRFNFDPVALTDAPPLDGAVAGAQCIVPPRPDVSNPRVTIGCDPTELSAGGVVDVQCARMMLTTEIVIASDTIVVGHGSVFDGQALARVFHVMFGAHLTLLDVTITNGTAVDTGAGVLVEFGGGLVVFDSTFTGNHGALNQMSQGGAIGVIPNNATVELYGSTFAGNTAEVGGAVQGFADLTIVNSVFDSNTATFTSGGAIDMAGNGALLMCGDRLTNNLAQQLGGAIFRVSPAGLSPDALTDLVIDNNRANQGGGGAYFMSAAATFRRVAVTNNSGAGIGGMWLQTMTIDAENLSVVHNRSDGGTGAGLRVDGAQGMLAFSTIADNNAACAGCFSSALDGASNLHVKSSIIVDNTAGTTPTSCQGSAIDDGGNFQWPTENPLCAAGATVTDPLLQPATSIGQITVRQPVSQSPVVGVATGCPATDILGRPRPTPCAAGAVEP